MGLRDRLTPRKPAEAPTPAAPATRPRGGTGRQHSGGFLDYDEINNNLRGQYGLRELDKMWRTDGAVRGSTYMVVAPIAGGTWTIEPFDGGDNDPTTDQDREVAEFVTWALFERMRPKLPSHIWTAMMTVARAGFGPFEQVYELAQWRGRPVFALRTLHPKRPVSIDKFNQDGADLVSIEQFNPAAEEARAVYPAQDLVYYRFGEEGDNWEGQPLIRPAYKHWKYKEGIELVDAMSIERFGMGVPIGYPPQSAGDEELDALETALAGIRANDAGYILAPGPKAEHTTDGNGYTIEILTPKTSEGQSQQTQQSLSYHRTEIYAAVLAEFMRLGQQGKGSGGARATAETQQDPFLALVEAIAGMVIEDAINEQLIPRLVALNFETDRLPRLACSLIDSTSLTDLATFVSTLAREGAIEVEPTLEAYLRDRADLPPRDEDALKAKADMMAEQAEQVAKAAQGNQDPNGGDAGDPDPKATGLDAVTWARQDRPLKPWEAHMSLDTIEGAIDEARARMTHGAGPAARDLALDLTAQTVRGRQGKPADPPEPLVTAIAEELASLYVTGRSTVREELDRQAHGLPPSTGGGYIFATGDDEHNEALAALLARARAAAHSVRSAIMTALARAALRRTMTPAGLQIAAEQAALGALRAEAIVHAAPALNAGRAAQAQASRDQIAGSRYTSILDGRACTACAGADDDVLRPLNDPVRLARVPPNPDCHGGDRCRCMEAFELRTETAPNI